VQGQNKQMIQSCGGANLNLRFELSMSNVWICSSVTPIMRMRGTTFRGIKRTKAKLEKTAEAALSSYVATTVAE
jgi:hypothetical protein